METTTVLSDKIRSIAERRQFTSFWEAFDFFKLASYSELEALQIASELFDGDVWKNVINASKKLRNNSSNNMTFFSGTTYTTNFASSGSTYVYGVDPIENEPDDVLVEIFVITKNANPKQMPIYKAYVLTRHYKEIPELESNIKIIQTELTTELAIKLFNDGQNNF